MTDLITICASCGAEKVDGVYRADRLHDLRGDNLSHGICPGCAPCQHQKRDYEAFAIPESCRIIEEDMYSYEDPLFVEVRLGFVLYDDEENDYYGTFTRNDMEAQDQDETKEMVTKCLEDVDILEPVYELGSPVYWRRYGRYLIAGYKFELGDWNAGARIAEEEDYWKHGGESYV